MVTTDNLKRNINDLLGCIKKILPIKSEKTHQRIKLEKIVKEIIQQLTLVHIDIKNEGGKENSVAVIKGDVNISDSELLTDENGRGKLATGSSLKQYLNIKIIKDGELFLSFKGGTVGRDKHLPIQVDYKSIKIARNEILSTPISCRYDKSFDYRMPVKNGQKIILEIEQQYHQYTEDELKDIVLKLYPKDKFVKNNIDEIFAQVTKVTGKADVTQLSDFPKITADCFIPLGSQCRPAEWLKRHQLRYCSLPFDWVAQYSLQFVCQSVEKGIDDWFAEYRELVQDRGKRHRCVYDTKYNFRGRHIFPSDMEIDEYMPEFKKLFARRFARFLEILKNSDTICFVCSNRNDTAYDFYLFIRKMQELYPNNKYKVLNVHHNEDEQSVSEYKFGDDIAIYIIEASDLCKKQDNSVAWTGNEDLWSDVCSRLSLSDNISKKILMDSAHNVEKKHTTTQSVVSKEEKIIARMDVIVKSVDDATPRFEIYFNDSEKPEKQTAWLSQFGNQGYIIKEEKENRKDIKLKILKDTDINVILRGILEKSADNKMVEHWVRYTSLVINDKELLSKSVYVWYNQPFRHIIQAKVGEEYKIHVEWAKSDAN